LFFSFFVFNNISFAQTLRCKGKIVKVGDSKMFVLNNCGEPETKEEITFSGRTGNQLAEKYYYKTGGRVLIVDIRAGKVTAIKAHRK
jgi:hypothetical protein